MTTTEDVNRCTDCKFAEFADYDKMNCLKEVAESHRNYCELFEELVPENKPSSYILSGKLNEIIEEDQTNIIAIEKEKQQNSEVLSIKNSETTPPEEVDNRIFTTHEITVYSDTDLFRKADVLPAGKLVKYRREVIRNGFHLLKMSNNDSNYYVEKELSKFKICEQCVTKGEPMDIILMSHADYDKYFLEAESGKRQIDEKFKNEISSLIECNGNQTIVRIIDKIEKDSKIVSTFNMLVLKGELKNIQIGRVDPDTKFYISETTKSKNVKKIVTTDEREAILISHPDAYKVISEPLWTAITIIIIIVTIIIAIYIIASVLSSTGYFVFWAFGLIVIGYLVIMVVGVPVYLIINRIMKYF